MCGTLLLRVQILLILESVENPLRSPQPTYLKPSCVTFVTERERTRFDADSSRARSRRACFFREKRARLFRKASLRSAQFGHPGNRNPKVLSLRGPLSPPQTPREKIKDKRAVSALLSAAAMIGFGAVTQ